VQILRIVSEGQGNPLKFVDKGFHRGVVGLRLDGLGRRGFGIRFGQAGQKGMVPVRHGFADADQIQRGRYKAPGPQVIAGEGIAGNAGENIGIPAIHHQVVVEPAQVGRPAQGDDIRVPRYILAQLGQRCGVDLRIQGYGGDDALARGQEITADQYDAQRAIHQEAVGSQKGKHAGNDIFDVGHGCGQAQIGQQALCLLEPGNRYPRHRHRPRRQRHGSRRHANA